MAKKNLTRAERNILWCERNIVIPEGKFVGQPLKMAEFMKDDFRAIFDNRASYAFGGVTNTAAQGYPVPLLYGRRRIGGAIISAGIYVEDQQ